MQRQRAGGRSGGGSRGSRAAHAVRAAAAALALLAACAEEARGPEYWAAKSEAEWRARVQAQDESTKAPPPSKVHGTPLAELLVCTPWSNPDHMTAHEERRRFAERKFLREAGVRLRANEAIVGYRSEECDLVLMRGFDAGRPRVSVRLSPSRCGGPCRDRLAASLEQAFSTDLKGCRLGSPGSPDPYELQWRARKAVYYGVGDEWKITDADFPNERVDAVAAEFVADLLACPYLRTYARLVADARQEETRRLAAAPQASDSPTVSPPPAPSVAPPPASQDVVSSTPQLAAYALIVGIEQYRDAPRAPGAAADARAFARVALTTLGIPEAHVRVAVDDRASKADIESHLAWAVSNVAAGGRLYFFFSGHGAPDAAHGTPYLFPYDGNPQAVRSTGIPLKDVLSRLAQSRAKETLAFVDACFSGSGGRSVIAPGIRPLVRVKEEPAPSAVAVFAASAGDEVSGPARGQAAGLFSRTLVDGLGTGAADADGDGQITLQELASWVKPRVAREALKDGRAQNPVLTVGGGIGAPEALSVAWGYKTK